MIPIANIEIMVRIAMTDAVLAVVVCYIGSRIDDPIYLCITFTES